MSKCTGPSLPHTDLQQHRIILLITPNENTASLQFPAVEYSSQALDFSSPTSSQHHIPYQDEILDLRVHRPSETIVKQECCPPSTSSASSSPLITVNLDRPSPSTFHPSVPYSHIPLSTNVVNLYPQSPNAVSPVSPLLVSNAIPLPSSSVIKMQPVAVPSTSRESPPIPFLPQHMLYHQTQSTEDPSTLQPVSSPENSPSDTGSIPALSPNSSLGLQLPPLPLLHPGNALPPLPIPNSAAGNRMKKCARPFKAISVRLGEPSAVSSEPYVLFRQRMLEQVKAISKSSGNKKRSPAVKRPSSPQPSSSSEGNPPDGKDAAYWERRKKNNEAAKRSRDARRAKEDELAIRTSFLERENWMLKYEVMRYRNCGFQLVPNNCVSNT